MQITKSLLQSKAWDVGEEQALRNKPGVRRKSKVTWEMKMIRKRPFLTAERIKAIIVENLM